MTIDSGDIRYDVRPRPSIIYTFYIDTDGADDDDENSDNSRKEPSGRQSMGS